ncbi:hypothetical protein PtA15_8A49 [Puccinia triticina]|uniref:Uncharacterized protein n=1 Tax=Puccinia triticina TaxID=208348 RepID=A0ABY7CS27_9BASI|nr:uncharacterized protein PtA15_8A49 [Puccinia triticina]WAQ87148.1 hypothetical protein PtA15_8A49 [Puccinia triticina]WAR57010.1 hypothetical protein PtB15_8B54 [Puccinia triticina]
MAKEDSAHNSERLESEKALIAKRFKELHYLAMLDPSEHHLGSSGRPSSLSTALIPENVDSTAASLHRLHSSILPELRKLVTELRTLITTPFELWKRPCDVQKEPGELVELISKSLSELELLFDQFLDVMKILRPGQYLHMSNRRARDVYEYSFDWLTSYFGDFCWDSCELITTSTEETDWDSDSDSDSENCTRAPYAKKQVDQHAKDMLYAIDRTLELIEGSKSDIVADHWSFPNSSINQKPKELFNLINRTNTSWWEVPLSQPVRNVAKWFAPIIKLLSIFFAKLSARRTGENRHQLFTKMRFDELDIIGGLAWHVDTELENVLNILKQGDTDGLSTTGKLLTQTLRTLVSHFNDRLRLIKSHFVPIIPDTNNPSTSQADWQRWFALWNSGFTLVIRNVKKKTRRLMRT